jgi:hypothetical protein
MHALSGSYFKDGPFFELPDAFEPLLNRRMISVKTPPDSPWGHKSQQSSQHGSQRHLGFFTIGHIAVL